MIPAPMRILVSESQVDPAEEQRDSGLVVRRDVHHPDCPNRVKRGVVLAVGSSVNEDVGGDGAVEPGDVIFYYRSDQVGDHHLVPASFDNLLGWEKDS